MLATGDFILGVGRMKTEKRDRRVMYTKLLLKNSLVKLLQKSPLEKITVKDLCECADINRSTFYSHYSDQYDLFQQIQYEVLEDLSNYLANYSYKGSEAELRQILQSVFEYIIANADLCLVLFLAENNAYGLQQAIMSIVPKLKVWEEIDNLDQVTLEYLQLFGVSGSVGIVKRWLQTGMTRTAPEMAELVVRLAYRGLSAYL